jgi:hypothetical protein
MVDYKNGLAARHCHLIAYQWYGPWLTGGMLGGRFLAGFSHDSVSLAEYFAPIAYPLELDAS